MGRPTKLTPEIQEIIVDAIRRGSFDHVAATAAGIGKSTFMRWLAAGGRGSPLYVEFHEAVSRARAEARISAEARVHAENPLAWLRYGPGRERPGEAGWTDAQRMELTGKDGGPIQQSQVVIYLPDNGRDGHGGDPTPAGATGGVPPDAG
jgi:hypothetical protein